MGTGDGDQHQRLGAADAGRCCRISSEQRYGKIVQLSGGGATNPLPRITAYAASKAAIVRLAESVALDVKDVGIDVNRIAPGALNTRMMDELLAAGAEAVGAGVLRADEDDGTRAATPLEVGAALAVFLGSAASDGITGRLLSAVWDPWERLPAASRRARSHPTSTPCGASSRRIAAIDVGRSSERPESWRRHRRLRTDRPEAGGGAAGGALVACADLDRAERAEALAASRPRRRRRAALAGRRRASRRGHRRSSRRRTTRWRP